MKKIDSYIISSFLGPFIITSAIVLFLFTMQFLWLYIDDIIGKGLSVIHIIKLLIFMSASFVPMALPLGVLISSIMTFGEMSEKYELSALKAAGIPISRIMRGLILFIFVIAIGSFVFANKVKPKANFEALNLLSNIRKQKPSLNIKEGVFDNSIPSFSIKVGRKKKDDLFDIIIYQVKKNEKTTITVANRGIMKKKEKQPYMQFDLFDGYSYEIIENTKKEERQPQYSTKFKKQTVFFDLSSFDVDKLNDKSRKEEISMMSVSQLNSSIDTNIKFLDKRLDNNIVKFNSTILISNLLNKKKDTILDLEKILFASVNNSNKNRILDKSIKKISSYKTSLEQNRNSWDFFNKKLNYSLIEIHNKYALAFSCIVMFFVGAPLGALIRKGGMGLPIVFSILIFIIFQIFSMTGYRMGKAGGIDPIFSSWMASLVLMPFGIWMTYKSTADSPLLNAEKIYKPFYWISDFIKKKKGKQIYFERKIKD